MDIKAIVRSSPRGHELELETGGRRQALAVPARTGGAGSAVNGGELLCAALATCFCNDLYREAGKRQILVHAVVVEVHAVFGGEGEPAQSLRYSAQVKADASDAVVRALVQATDAVTEIQNTLRSGCSVELVEGPIEEAPVA